MFLNPSISSVKEISDASAFTKLSKCSFILCWKLYATLHV